MAPVVSRQRSWDWLANPGIRGHRGMTDALLADSGLSVQVTKGRLQGAPLMLSDLL